MSNLFHTPMLMGLTAFIAGAMVATLLRVIRGGKAGRKSKAAAGAVDSEHRIRALEADLRISRQNEEDLEERLTAAQQELALVNDESLVLRKTLESRDVDLTEAKKTINDECMKTAELRRELTGRAEETIRAQVQIKNIETELDVAQAGSEVVAEQVHRLTEERENLTDRLRALSPEKVESERKRAEKDEKFDAGLHFDTELIVDS